MDNDVDRWLLVREWGVVCYGRVASSWVIYSYCKLFLQSARLGGSLVLLHTPSPPSMPPQLQQSHAVSDTVACGQLQCRLFTHATRHMRGVHRCQAGVTKRFVRPRQYLVNATRSDCCNMPARLSFGENVLAIAVPSCSHV